MGKEATAYARIVEALLDRDQRHSGNDYICPAHDDNKPSLGVKEGDGRVLINCGAGCKPEDVMAKLGMTMRDLRDGSRATHKRKARDSNADPPDPLPPERDIKRWHRALMENETQLRHMTKTRLIARSVLKKYKIGWDANRRAFTFPLRDADGVLRNVKWKPRDKRRKPSTVKGRPLFLWPADQLNERYVVLCEGEEDALVLLSHEIPAVTVPNGAGSGKWRPEWNRLLTAKRVAVVLDSDDAGRNLAREVAQAISGYASAVRVADLAPDRADGFDVTDWFREKAGNQESFLRLLKEAPAHPPHRLQVVSAWHRLERLRQEPAPRWLFRNVWMAGTYGVLAGPPKAGKSWDIAAIVVSAASAHPLWGLVEVDEPTEVLYFVGEDDEWLTLQRLEAIAEWTGQDPAKVLSRIHIAEAVPRFDDRSDLDIVRQQLEANPDVGFTAIEPLYLSARGADARQLFDMAGFLGAIQQVVVNEARSGLLVGHHWNQAGKGRGPERIAGAGPAEWGRVLLSGQPSDPVVQQDFYLKREMVYEVSGSRIPNRTIEVSRSIRQEDPDNPASPYGYRATARVRNEAREGLSPTEKETLEALTEAPSTANEVKERMSKSHDTKTIREALKSLSNLGIAATDEKSRDRRYWLREHATVKAEVRAS